jgi:hypothetical protein
MENKGGVFGREAETEMAGDSGAEDDPEKRRRLTDGYLLELERNFTAKKVGRFTADDTGDAENPGGHSRNQRVL